jgi:hypothetical protein
MEPAFQLRLEYALLSGFRISRSIRVAGRTCYRLSQDNIKHLIPSNPSTTHLHLSTMPLATRRAAAPRTTRTTHTHAKPSLKTRILGPTRTTAKRTPAATTTTTTTTTRTTRSTAAGHHSGGHATTAAPVHHHKRKASVGDKVSGALMKLKGSLTSKPGLKV